MNGYTEIDLASKNASERYKLLTGTVVPRPIAFVSTVNPAGGVNLAPFSQFIIIAANPGLLGFSASRRMDDGKNKDTVANASRTGELVINITTPKMAGKVQSASAEFDSGISEAERLDIALISSRMITPPRVEESPVQFECHLEKIIEIGDLPNSLVVARVILMHVRNDLLMEGSRIDINRLDPLGRIAGRNFCTLGDIIAV